MRISQNVHERTVNACRRYSRLMDAFERFYAGGQYLTAPQSKLENFSFEPSLENNYFDVLFLGMRTRFLFVPRYDDDDSLQGNVYCSRCHPRFSETPQQLGSFKFDGRGITDFEVDQGRDQFDIETNAPEIILHFVNEALARPLQ